MRRVYWEFEIAKWSRNLGKLTIDRQGITQLSRFSFFLRVSSLFIAFFVAWYYNKTLQKLPRGSKRLKWRALALNILMWYIKVIKYLQCLFFVINENESALIIGSKLNPPVTTSDTNWSLKERCKTDDMSTVSSGVPPWSCFSCQDPSGSSRRKVTTQRPLDFFSNKLSLELEISSCFPSLISSFQRATAR